MKISIITAMPKEFRAVTASFGSTGYTGTGASGTARCCINGNEILVVESGMGFRNAARTVEVLVSEALPDLLVSAGFCGGLSPELLVGDVVVADKIVIATENCLEEIPVLLTDQGRSFVERQAEEGIRIVEGTYVSTSTIRSKSHLAGMLSNQHCNPVVEMESGAIARVAAVNHIPLLAIRAVSDSVSEELGFSLEDFCDPDMRHIRPYKVLLTSLRKPRIIPQLVRLSRSSTQAAQSLTAALSRLFSTF